jgi:hypothetical protein
MVNVINYFDSIELKLADLYDYDFPEMIPVHQKFESRQLADISGNINREMNKAHVKEMIRSGQRIAVAVGSRGIASLPVIVKAVIDNLKLFGADPFIVPAMGSHGGATGSGQIGVLAGYGVTEEAMGAPIISSMDTVVFKGKSLDFSVHFSKDAYQADGIVIIGRIKPHTDFKGPYESGLMKMLTIGLGKHKGAINTHLNGLDNFADTIPKVGSLILDKAKILFGIAIIEDAYDNTSHIEVVAAADFKEREPVLLEQAKQNLGIIKLEEFDVLIVEEIGKEISGMGMDPNVIGRPASGLPGFNGPLYQRLVVFDLTVKTNGNAFGLGVADVTTIDAVKKIDFDYFYINCITGTNPQAAKIPLVAKSEKEAVLAAFAMSARLNKTRPRIVYIKNTLELEKIYVSEALLEEVAARDDLDIIGKACQFGFSETGRALIRPSTL